MPGSHSKILLLAGMLCAMSRAQGLPSFDAASVKPSDPASSALIVPGPPGAPRLLMWRNRTEGGPETDDPGRIRYTQSLLLLIAQAFEVTPLQIKAPDDLAGAHVDIDAIMPATTTRHEFHLMLQDLLAKRFQLSFHRETVNVPGYALVLANKHKPLLQTVSADTQPNGVAPIYSSDGLIKPRFTGTPGIHRTKQNRGVVVAFERQTMADLAAYLQEQFDCPIVDATRQTVLPWRSIRPIGAIPPKA